jgi:hypothetical protein
MERILQPAAVRDKTIDSEPTVFIVRPLNSPCVALVPAVHAVSPATITLMGLRTAFTAREN